MKTLGERSLSSLLESILLFIQVCIWIVVVAFLVIPLLPLENTAFSFTTPITHGLRHETEGPGGTWTLRATWVEVTTTHDQGWIGSLAAIPFLALIAFVVGELRAVFRSLRDGSPFIAANARRIRRIGLSVLVFEALRVVVTITVVAPALERLKPVVGGAVIQADAWPSGMVVFLGCAVLVLAEVFRRGTRMHDEQALTV